MIQLIVVAHPDDEILWFFETINQLKAAGEKVVLLAVTHGDHPVRKLEFEASCKALGVSGNMLALKDQKGSIPLKGAYRAISKFIAAHPVQRVITHSPHGDERNHLHHIQLFYTCSWIAKTRGLNFGFSSTTAIGEAELKLVYSLKNRHLKRLIKSIVKYNLLGFVDYITPFLQSFYFCFSKPHFSEQKLTGNQNKEKFFAIYRSQKLDGEYQAANTGTEYLYVRA